jgi:hypothetical protein
MRKNKTLILLFSSLFSFAFANAQLEVSHLYAKGFSSTGVGAFFNWGTLVSPGDAITFETGLIIYSHTVVIPSGLVGYRHTFNKKGTGLFVEPQLTYLYGASNIPKRDSTEFPLLSDGKGYINQPNISGLTPSLELGYIFPGKFAFNLGVRYQHVFVFGDPAVNILSLRVAHTFVFGRSRWYH